MLQIALGVVVYVILVIAGAGTGLKQRLKYLLADPDSWPIDVGVYGELTETESEVENPSG